MSETPGKYEANGDGQELAVQPKTLTVTQLHERLKSEGIEIPYTILSTFLKVPEVAAKLGIGGNGGRKEVPEDAVSILVAFIPWFRAQSIPWNVHAAPMIQKFVKDDNAGGALLPPSHETLKPIEPDPLALAAMQGKERIMTAKEAAEEVGITVSMLRKTVKPYRRFGKSATGDRWLLSDLVRPDPDS